MQCLIVVWFREIHNTSRYTKAMNWLVTKYKTGVKQESFMKANHWLETSGSRLDKPRLFLVATDTVHVNSMVIINAFVIYILVFMYLLEINLLLLLGWQNFKISRTVIDVVIRWLMCYIWSTSIILCLGDAIWRHRSGSTLVQAMACRNKATSRYLSQCWLITSKVKWHLSTDNYTRDSFKSPWGQWMKYGLSLYTDT